MTEHRKREHLGQFNTSHYSWQPKNKKKSSSLFFCSRWNFNSSSTCRPNLSKWKPLEVGERAVKRLRLFSVLLSFVHSVLNYGTARTEPCVRSYRSACLRAFFSNSTNLLVPAGSYFGVLNLRIRYRSGLTKGIILIAQGMRYMVVLITRFFIFVSSAPFSYVQSHIVGPSELFSKGPSFFIQSIMNNKMFTMHMEKIGSLKY